ncbi:Coatomer subunit beta-2 [Hibiscus syriacus]|uniref:Coatomer subunit beta-2 n=1 Tax=Hibiscus syriacus TaxID=106335 RepID=A0A6A3CZJ3_HIBSY|nr:Coatomer subunit beta-2 [Hibiscus syriacus]
MEKTCTLLIHLDKGTPAIANEIKEALDGNDVPAKVDAMTKAIMLLLNGETLPQLFITIVRRNAILAVMSIYKLPQDRAINYLLTHVDRVSDWGELLQMVVLELIHKVCRTNRAEKGKAAANTYCQLLLSQSDNNVKLIVLDRLNDLKSSHRDIMVDLIMDVLSALSSPNLDIRRKTLDIVLDLITPRNINEVALMLKKEVVKTQSGELEKKGEYRQMLIQAIHSCAIKFPEVASTVVHLLMDFLGDSNIASAIVVVFVREIIETNPKLRVSIITTLLDTFYQIRAARVCSCALWIVGEYCLSLSEVESGIATIKQCLGELPFYSVSEEGEGTDASKKTPQANSITVSSRRPAIFPDGVQPSKVEVNKATTQSLLIIVSMLQLGQSPFLPHPIDNDSYDRIVLCIRLLCNTGDDIRKIWLQSCRQSSVKTLSDKQLQETEELKAKAQVSHAQPDDLIDFFHLKSRKGMSQLELEDEVQDDLKHATGEFVNDTDDANKLNRILQLTGFSDPVYAEAYVTVHHYYIVLDITVINRTKETLQNLCLELATMGDLKLVERPQNYTLSPESSKQIKANIKVAVNTVIQDEKEFLEHIIKSTNMKCLTPLSALDDECGFLAANLYAESVFGEDALVNLSVKKQADGKLSGYIRIRSKTQGFALSLGNKITLKQKGSS